MAVWIGKLKTTHWISQETFHAGSLLLLTADMIEGEQDVVIYCELSRELNFHFFIEVRRPVSKAHNTQITVSKNEDISDDKLYPQRPFAPQNLPAWCFAFHFTPFWKSLRPGLCHWMCLLIQAWSQTKGFVGTKKKSLYTAEKSTNQIWRKDEVWSPAVTSFSICTPRTGTGTRP